MGMLRRPLFAENQLAAGGFNQSQRHGSAWIEYL